MKTFIKAKYFTLGLVVGIGVLSIGAYATGTQAGTIGELFVKITATVGDDIDGSYRLDGKNIKDDTVDNTEINNAGTYEVGKLGIGTNSPSRKLDVNGNIRTRSRSIYFGDGEQRIYGNNASAFYVDSNHDTVSQLIFRDKQDDIYGRVYGVDGDYFGLRDGDNNRSYLTHKDDYTQFRINNSTKMHIESNGNIGIGTTSPSEKLDVVGNTEINGNLNMTTHYIKGVSCIGNCP